MAIDRDAGQPTAPERRTPWITALVAAALVLSAAAVPASAAEGVAEPSTWIAPTPAPSAEPTPTAAEALPSPSASPSDPPSPSPSPSPSGDASPSPSAGPSEEPSAPPSPSPTPSATPTPTPLPWPTAPTTLGSTVTFYGRGWGHGVGMSQYGARGRALAGQDSATILAAYYQGSRQATIDPSANVRVLVLAGFDARSKTPLLVFGRGGPWTLAGVSTTFPADAALRAWRVTAGWKVRVDAPDGTMLYRAPVGGSVRMLPAAPSTRLQVWSRPSAYDTYRGSLKVVLGSTSANVVNHVPLDQYLRGVVPVEMPASWPGEALEAQAIAARSYAYRHLHPTTGSYDVYDDTRSQVYRGVEGEKAAADAAIERTTGLVLKSGSGVVNAVFHSTAGGATENNEYVFVSSAGKVGTPVSYLRGISDRLPDGSAYDAAAPYYAWRTSTLTRAQLSTMLASDSRTRVGELLRLDLTRRGVSGRLYRVTLVGTTANKTVSADVFRAVYNAARPSGTNLLRGNLFDTRPLP